MKSYIKLLDGFSPIVKIIIALPFFDILWNIYRLVKSLEKKNVLGIVIAIILLLPGAAFMWLVDIISLLVVGKILWID